MRKSGDSIVLYSHEGREILPRDIDREKLLLYVSYFDDIYFEEEIIEDSVKLRVEETDPFFKFVIKTSDVKNFNFSIYPLYMPDGKKDVFFGGLKIKEDSRIYKVNYIFLDLILQDIDYFLAE